jgi:fucose permease
MSLPITNQDRKKVKTTYIVAAILFALFALLSILFGVLIPDAKEVQALGEGKEDIRGIVERRTVAIIS